MIQAVAHLASRLLFPPAVMNTNSPSLLKLASALVGRHSQTEVVSAALSCLEAGYPGTLWALLEGSARSFASDGVGAADLSCLAETAGVEWTETAREVSPLELGAPRASSFLDVEGASLVLGAWVLPGGEEPSSVEIELATQLIADALRGAREVEALRRLSQTDALTGVLSRRAIHEVLEREEQRARRHGRQLAVLYLDMDRFKQINDAHGHAVGDLALQHLGHLLVGEVRAVDAVGRVGGDEFVLVLPDTSTAQAEKLARRIQAKLQKSPLVLRGAEGDAEVSLELSASIGVAAAGGTAVLDLVERADRRMLADKRRRGAERRPRAA